jgi:hypothetical protein
VARLSKGRSPANFTGLGVLLWNLVDRRDAGRHAVAVGSGAVLLPGAASGASSSARAGSRATFYALDEQLVTRTSAAGRSPAPCAAALENVKKVLTTMREAAVAIES